MQCATTAKSALRSWLLAALAKLLSFPLPLLSYDARLGGIPPPADSLLAGCLKSGGMGQAAAAKAHDASKMVHWTTLLDGPGGGGVRGTRISRPAAGGSLPLLSKRVSMAQHRVWKLKMGETGVAAVIYQYKNNGIPGCGGGGVHAARGGLGLCGLFACCAPCPSCAVPEGVPPVGHVPF